MLDRRFGKGLLNPKQGIQNDLLRNALIILAYEKQMVNGEDVVQRINKVLSIPIVKLLP